jgi:hypothetical protein
MRGNAVYKRDFPEPVGKTVKQSISFNKELNTSSCSLLRIKFPNAGYSRHKEENTTAALSHMIRKKSAQA